MSNTAVDEIQAVLEDWMSAYRAKDMDGLERTAIGDDIQLVGTGADEVRFGLAEFREQAMRDFSQADELDMVFTDIRSTVIDNAAFVYCDVTVSGSAGGQSFEMSGLRLTLGLVRTPDGWRFVQTHLSSPDGAQDEGSSFEG